MTERSDFEEALHHLATGGHVVIYRSDVMGWDGDLGRIVQKQTRAFVAPAPVVVVGYTNDAPMVFEFPPEDDQLVQLLNMDNVRDERLSAAAMKLLKRLSQDDTIGEVPGTAEAQELLDTGCTRGTFATTPGPDPKTIYIVERLTTIGEATLRAVARARARAEQD